ncbi:MAG: oligoendopeptidase F, partial [Oscillospiraceae bacterium]|nr:oligoendopeptidase F [Oscillospiraceae bacterium]
MDFTKIPERNEIPEEFTWDLTDMFPSDAAWLDEYNALMAMPETIAPYAGTLGESAAQLLAFLRLDDELSVRLEMLSGYANCKGDQDLADGFYQDL